MLHFLLAACGTPTLDHPANHNANHSADDTSNDTPGDSAPEDSDSASEVELSDAQLNAAFSGAYLIDLKLEWLMQEAENDALNALDSSESPCPSIAVDGTMLTLTGNCSGNAGMAWAGSLVVDNYPTDGWWHGEVAAELGLIGNFTLTATDFSLDDGDEVMAYTGVVSGSWPDDSNVLTEVAFDITVTGESTPAFHSSGGWSNDLATTPTVVSVEGLPELTLLQTSYNSLYSDGFTLLGEGIEIEVNLMRKQDDTECFAAVVNGQSGRWACRLDVDASGNGSSIERNTTVPALFTVVDADWVDGSLVVAAATSGDEDSIEAHVVGTDRTSVEVHPVFPTPAGCNCVAYTSWFTANGTYDSGRTTALAAGSDTHTRVVAYDAARNVLGCKYEGLDPADAGLWFDAIDCPE